MSITRGEIKVTIAKFIEAAYSEDKGLTAKIVATKGPFKLTVDADGKGTLSSTAGNVTFSGSPVLDKAGANIKMVSVTFSPAEGREVKYHATFDLKVAKLSVSGGFDLEELITSCSGLLCKAAKAMKGRHQAYELELQRIMGH